MTVRLPMVDLKKATEELTANAVLAAARGKLEDALSTEEEREQRKAKEAALAKRKRTKLLVMGAVGLLLVLGVIGMVVNYWQWFLLLGLLGLGALYGRHRWRNRSKLAEKASTPPRPRVEQPKAPARVAAPEQPVRPESSETIEDELAALKARLDK